jgi:hypothetical protein
METMPAVEVVQGSSMCCEWPQALKSAPLHPRAPSLGVYCILANQSLGNPWMYF